MRLCEKKMCCGIDVPFQVGNGQLLNAGLAATVFAANRSGGLHDSVAIGLESP